MKPRYAYSIKQCLDIVPIGHTAIYDLIKRGKLRAVKNGRRTLILDQDLRAFLASLPAIGDIPGDDDDDLEDDDDLIDPGCWNIRSPPPRGAIKRWDTPPPASRPPRPPMANAKAAPSAPLVFARNFRPGREV